MSYEKTNWQTGDVITAQKLNNAENGIETVSSSLIAVEATYEDFPQELPAELSCTAQELKDAIMMGRPILYCFTVPIQENGSTHYEEVISPFFNVEIYEVYTDSAKTNLDSIHFLISEASSRITPYGASSWSDYPTKESLNPSD